MYHYLKWAALSYFFKRNLRSLIFVFLGLAGIYSSDAVYQDLKDYALSTDQKDLVFYFLLGKWALDLISAALLVYGVMNLGLGKGTDKRRKNSRVGKSPKNSENPVKETERDAVMERLEKFRGAKRLRRRSDLLIKERGKKRPK
ncbi:hypothetical protein [Nitratifractor salsuginis]|uniref:Uncharacterized protein n=1 Tax=Nitratifractor salsuginis (strain DSM 16511 / JCM 12458 / E9I37-1) TaxID=749222 RepID=E6X3D0_NITSE|nr:hypothetical protein [Nitratifractor salsuginis]ADV47343.1 hypothetical protein Nitsa_2102 [Nitratifractor salsuginis DSM 16511]